MTTLPCSTAFLLLLACPVLAAPPTDTEKQLQVQVVGVHDGDTITGLTAAKKQVKVRLDAIDAVETAQPAK